jgi:hypothetical protein
MPLDCQAPVSLYCSMAKSKPNTVKTAYDFAPEVKHKLSTLKADLRLKGIPATETGIISVLVEGAKLESLTRLYRRTLLGN